MWGQSEDSYNQFLINISDTIRPLEFQKKKKSVCINIISLPVSLSI